MTVPGRSRRTHPGRRSSIARRPSPPRDITVVNNIPVTTVARTLLDLGELSTQRQLERAFDQAESLQALDGRAINDQLARNPTRPGAKTSPPRPRRPTTSEAPRPRTKSRKPSSPSPASLGLPDPRAQSTSTPATASPRSGSTSPGPTDGSSSRPTAARPTARASLRDGPPSRPAPHRRRLDRHPHHLAPDPPPAARAATDPAQATGTRVSRRSRETSRCRRPSARATSYAARRRKHRMAPRPHGPSLAPTTSSGPRPTRTARSTRTAAGRSPR